MKAGDCSVSFALFYLVQDPVHGMMPSTLSVVVLNQLKLSGKSPTGIPRNMSSR